MNKVPVELTEQIVNSLGINDIKEVCKSDKYFRRFCLENRNRISRRFYNRANMDALKFLFSKNNDEYNLLKCLSDSSDELPSNSNKHQRKCGLDVYNGVEFLVNYDKETAAIWYLYYVKSDDKFPSSLKGSLKEFKKDYEITDVTRDEPTLKQQKFWEHATY